MMARLNVYTPSSFTDTASRTLEKMIVAVHITTRTVRLQITTAVNAHGLALFYMTSPN